MTLVRAYGRSRRSRLLPICAFFLLLSGYPVRGTPPDSAKVFGRIAIQNLGVFDPQLPQYDRFPYPLLNRLHLKTRPWVIRQELLFRPGSRFDTALVEESARNLRKFSFLGPVSITPVQRADTVDVVVRTEDQWTTTPDLVVDRRGNLSRLGIGIEEANFLGFGKYFNLRFQTATDRNLMRVIYEDPRLFGNFLTLRAKGIKTSEGNLVQVRFSRPQYSLGTRWTLDAGFRRERSVFRLYDDGQLSAAVSGGKQVGDLSMTRIWGSRLFQQKFAVELAAESQTFSNTIDGFRPAARSAQTLLATGPVDHQNLRLGVSWKLDHFRFVKKRAIDHAGLIEDIETGQSVALTAGQALGLGNRDSYSLFSASFVESATLGDAHLAILAVEGGGRFEGGRFTNRTFDIFYHHYFQGLPHQTLVFGAAYDQAWNMDQPFQLVLGEDVGLRGYPARQFTGNRLLLLNVEDRVFTPIELATLRLGFATFFDAGMAWPEGRGARWQDLRSSAGVSLRLGMIKFADDPVFRLDLSFPLRRDPGVGRYSIGFSFAPIFGSFRGPEAIVSRF